tara:strand:+ start:234 stop:782 length:549 start_codon:yes stop_codon:yes gene_type:complete
MFKYFFFIFFLTIITNSKADNKSKIIENLNQTENLTFLFEQNINGKIDNGKCVIKYPKKIFCEYSKKQNKILVSNGKSLVIKTRTGYFRYPLKKTALNFILDKNFLINKIYDLEERISDKSYINYKIIENDNKISIFFDKKTFNLVGWQTKDIYQNLSITFLSSIKKNQFIDNKIFKIPSSH